MGTPWVSFDGKDCSGCKHLNERDYCEFTGCVIPCTVRATIPDVKPQTNADRIRSMSDEELAKFMALNTDCYYCKANDLDRCASLTTAPCGDIWLDWLRQATEL